MTEQRTLDTPGTFILEFDCARRCQVEFDLAEAHIRFTHGQMVEHAKAAHRAAHAKTEKVFRFHDWTIVRAAEPDAGTAL